MAVQAYKSTEQADGYRGTPVNDHGKLRFQFFDVPAIAAQADATSTIDLCRLPPGRLRVIPNLSRISYSAMNATTTVDVGHTAYQSADQTTEAADPDAFTPDELPAETDAVALALGPALKFDVNSKSGILIQATINTAAMPIAGTMSGCIAYIQE